MLNLYSPNKTPDQCSLFSQVLSTLDEADSVPSGLLIIGGDFNAHLDAEMDSKGGRKGKKDLVKNITDFKLAYDLVDIWRIKNPEKRNFTWRQKKTLLSNDALTIG